MNIVNIAPNAPYNEGWGYQENLLPKYQAKLGNNVSLIIRNYKHQNGRLEETTCEDYISKDGFRVIRRKTINGFIPKIGRLFSKMEVYSLLRELKPDFVFYHGLVSSTIFQVTKYKRKINPNLVIVQDNHLDYNIGFGHEKNLKQKLICFVHRIMYAMNDQFISKVYGVTPWRKEYAEDVFGVPKTKTDVLIMGADDEKIDFVHREVIRRKIREQYGIAEGDFLVVTGGKIDAKKKIDVLMQAVSELKDVKLLVFGNVLDDVKCKFDEILKKSSNVIYIGWIDASKVYDYFFAADLVFFPGQHSVLWEQACASKVPCVFEKWDGMEHVNNGGNADFVFPINNLTIKNKIEELKFTPKYYEMKQIAESSATDVYLYSSIAKKSLECAING